MEKEKILITSALPYANGPLHFGHIAGAYLPGDCYARFERMQGNDVLYVCGSDEYGMAITLSAEQAKRSNKEHVDLFHEMNHEFFKKLNFSFDHYSRTTWDGHKEPVQEFFLDLYHNGYIEKKDTEQLYSEKEGRFFADRYVTGTCPKCSFEQARGDECPKCGASYEAIDLINPVSRLSGAVLSKKVTTHWFLMLDKLKDQVLAWLEQKQWKPNVLNFIKNYLKDLRPRAITRDSDWGIPVPLEEAKGKVLYVWFDAPIGYISISQQWAQKIGEPDRWQDFWMDPKTKLVNFIGKDNISFHAVIFPAMIMGQNKPYKLVDELPANEFYNLQGRQFSKSDGWYIDLDRFFKQASTDQIRYAIAASAPETADSEFSWKEFQSRCNADLVGKLGNFVNRCMVFAQKNCEGRVPPLHDLTEADQEFLDQQSQLFNELYEAYRAFSLRKVTKLLMDFAQKANVYFDHQKPWQVGKDPSYQSIMENCLACCFEAVKRLALACYPIMPQAAEDIWSMLGNTKSLEKLGWEQENLKLTGQKLGAIKVLFQKIPDEWIEEEIAHLEKTLNKKQSAPASAIPLKDPISFDTFSQVDLRVGKILQAQKVPKSKKLLQLEVDIGLEKRTIVSGISQFYEEAELIGKKVIVVANLKPAKLMGIESQGMLLAASLDQSLELAQIGSIPEGGQVS